MLVLAGILAPVRPAWSESEPEAGARIEARAHFEEGLQLAERGELADALAQFDESLRLLPTHSAAFNRAVCLRLMGRYVEAALALAEYEDQYVSTDDVSRRAELDRELAELEPRIGRLMIRATGPATALVSIDGEQRGSTPLSAPIVVTAGRHELLVQSEGYHPAHREFDMRPGGTLEVEMPLRAVTGEATLEVIVSEPGATITVDGEAVGTSPLASPFEISIGSHRVEAQLDGFLPAWAQIEVEAGEPERLELVLRREGSDEAPSRGSSLRIGGYVLAGLAVAALGTALGLGIWNAGELEVWEAEDQRLRALYSDTATDLSSRSHWQAVEAQNERHENIQRADVGTWVVVGVGGSAAIAAVALLIVGYRRDRSPPVGSLSPSPNGLGASFGVTLWEASKRECS